MCGREQIRLLVWKEIHIIGQLVMTEVITRENSTH